MMERLPDSGVDLIGDVHGCGALLARLLETMGYRRCRGVWCHPSRYTVFLGDLIDRGPEVRQALEIVYRMVESGRAQVVLGNHELRALRECLPAAPGRAPAPPPGSRGAWIMQATLEQFRDAPALWGRYLEWFLEMPLCIESDTFRVAHALWDEALLRSFIEKRPDGRIDRDFLARAAEPGSIEQRTLDRTTRGVQLPLPEDRVVHARDGFIRKSFRAHFWAEAPVTRGDVIFQPDPLPGALEACPLTDDERARLVFYAPDERPLFVGHYWREGVPALPTGNIACLDYSAVRSGRLVAYRFDGERQLDARRFCWVSTRETAP